MPGHAHVVGAVPDGVTLHLGDRIVVTRGHLTRAATGEELSGPIILATGAIPRTVPSLADAHVLRTAEDASRLRETLGGGGRGVDVVGAGVLGMEATGSLTDAGHRVRVHDVAPEIMSRMLPDDAAAWLRGVHERRGVDFALGGEPQLDDGTVTVAAIGVRPDTELAEQLGLEVADGVVVDELGRTSRTGIYAAGDCAALRVGDCLHRDEDLASARASGIRGATGVLVDAGETEAPDAHAPAPARRWSVQAGLRVTTIGEVVGTGTEPGAGAEHIVVVSEAEEFESVVVRDGLVIGAVAVAKRPNPRGIAAAVGHPWDR